MESNDQKPSQTDDEDDLDKIIDADPDEPIYSKKDLDFAVGFHRLVYFCGGVGTGILFCWFVTH
jgi:hypothetical protein